MYVNQLIIMLRVLFHLRIYVTNIYILKAVNNNIPVFVTFLCLMSTFRCLSDWVQLVQLSA